MTDTRNLTHVAATLACSDKLTWADWTNKKKYAVPRSRSPSHVISFKTSQWQISATHVRHMVHTVLSVFIAQLVPRTWHHDYLEHLDHLDGSAGAVIWLRQCRCGGWTPSCTRRLETPAARLLLQTRRRRTHAHKPNLSSPTLASTSHSPSPPLTAASSEQDFTPPT